MKLTDIYKSKKNILSFEIFPPKHDAELKDIEPTLDILSELKPDYIYLPSRELKLQKKLSAGHKNTVLEKKMLSLTV